MRGASRGGQLGVPQIAISLDTDALHFECKQGASHEQHVTLRNTGPASRCKTCQPDTHGARPHAPSFLGLAQSAPQCASPLYSVWLSVCLPVCLPVSLLSVAPRAPEA